MYIILALYLLFVVGVIFLDEILEIYRVYGVKNYILYQLNSFIAAIHKFFKL